MLLGLGLITRAFVAGVKNQMVRYDTPKTAKSFPTGYPACVYANTRPLSEVDDECFSFLSR